MLEQKLSQAAHRLGLGRLIARVLADPADDENGCQLTVDRWGSACRPTGAGAAQEQWRKEDNV